jgi:hypothetical protein
MRSSVNRLANYLNLRNNQGLVLDKIKIFIDKKGIITKFVFIFSLLRR